MRSELLTRARSAVTLPDECSVIFDAVLQSSLPKREKQALLDIVDANDVPRPVLLGVVAVLVPRRDDIATINLRIWPNAIGPGNGETEAELCGWVDAGPSVDEPVIGDGSAATPALALLIAILEANNAEA